MKLKAFCLRDVKADTYGAPFFVPNVAIAVRLLGEMVQDRRTDVGKYPADFSLYSVGSYETNTGLLEASELEMVCSAVSCLPKEDPRLLKLPSEEIHGGAAV